jgi:septal ring factor EnvC (AmiA/AmiB activator)
MAFSLSPFCASTGLGRASLPGFSSDHALFHFAQDAARGRDEATAANRAFEELMGERQQQLTDYKLRVEQLEISLATAQAEKKGIRKQLMDHELKIKQLEADLEKAKREAQAMRDKLDEWCRPLNRGGVGRERQGHGWSPSRQVTTRGWASR